HFGSGNGRSAILGTSGYGWSLSDSLVGVAGEYSIKSDWDVGLIKFILAGNQRVKFKSNGQ
ncbi:MAG: hypothetical protein RLZZ309_777, partial [Bacteroidota bacterium]